MRRALSVDRALRYYIHHICASEKAVIAYMHPFSGTVSCGDGVDRATATG